ncbi:uncharacterized protein BYT42DRAFT_617019 [Radiomyces spectabilis]|uniref:uncharacterized protein n=1 Tax=Radiomyces spectabilis TaxID=64574 RepID=UPI002220D7CC|nr:uncharacterized protein BYT42DRAFT_617019 [Radiomyces spectabilis]KAI8370471.1 hypothetical protein BYT42DRAFT_617019 [Radiomyces spectabilis]
MTKPEDAMSNDQKPFTRISMEPLYERLLKKPFPDSVSAIEYCRTVCGEFGFTVKQEASANRNIYVYCSREGLPDSQRNPKPSPQRKRPSKRCDCRWRVVLSENERKQWEFRKSMNPNASEHNHEMMSPDEMVKAWPAEVNDTIIQLARQRLQTHEIREAVKQRFPDITWNERRFYNRLTEERKRIRQRGVVERSQRLLLLSARLCSVVASNEDWALCVENDLARMFENFCQLSRLPPEAIHTLVDLQTDLIQNEADKLTCNTNRLSLGDSVPVSAISTSSPMMSDLDDVQQSPAKRRKSLVSKMEAPKGTQIVSVPNYLIYVRSQPLRSSSDSSSQGSRRTFSPSGLESPSPQTGPPAAAFGGNSTTSFFSLASPTSSSSSSSSSMPFHNHPHQQQQQQQQRLNRLDISNQQRTVPSPHPSLHSPNDTPFLMNQGYAPTHQPQPQPQQATGYTVSGLPAYNMQASSFSPYTMAATSFSSPPEMSFTFDNTAMAGLGGHRAHDRQLAHPLDIRQPAQATPQQPTSPSVFGFYPVREEQNAALQQRAMLQRQQQEYEQRMQRSFSQGYTPLPMIRSNDDHTGPTAEDVANAQSWA